MNRFIFKKHLLAIALLLLCGVSAQAADDDLITQQITIKLDKAGTLPNKIGSSKKYKITNLKIVGEINGTDLLLIRDMSGSNYRGFRTSGNLVFLDLSDAKIVSGGDYYYYIHDPFYSRYYYTAKDELGDFAFYECSKLKNIIIPSNVTIIGESAFQGCSGLTNLNIPSRVTAISVGAFQGCSGLTSLNIPSRVTTIREYAFKGCSGLTNLNIPSTVTYIGESAFDGCSGLTCINIPSITTISSYTFYGCSGLTSLNIPSTVTYIGNDAFRDCNLASIYVSRKTPLVIDGSVFKGVNKEKCVLYVPQDSYQDYWLAEGWGDFKNIVEYDATKVGNSVVDKEIKEVARYTANGQRLDAPTKGLNIVRYSDGSVRKELHN